MKMRIWIFFALLLTNLGVLISQVQVQKWHRFEKTFQYNPKVNPFTDIKLTATFTNPDTTFTVHGFYDGDSNFKIRFMPQWEGIWTYKTTSNIPEMDNQQGNFICVAASGKNQGMLKVADTYHFKYENGDYYYPFGTTLYAWTHMDEKLRKLTLENIQKAGFNKVRMCVLPKAYGSTIKEPVMYPFKLKKMHSNKAGKERYEWDFEEFNPTFFQNLEQRIYELDSIGTQADLILFHPYDENRWGFDEMPHDMDVRYLEYVTARISSFKNVWWSLANEWGYLKEKSVADWDDLIRTTVKNDPYGHLCSIHGPTAVYYNYMMPELTHVSIQDEAPVLTSFGAATLRNIYKKPILLDEVGYEGNLSSRWGRLSPQKLTHLFWNGIIAGGYVTHGEVYDHGKEDNVVWSNGGTLVGESWKRIKFLKELMEAGQGPLFMSDISRDLVTASAGNGYYLIYFGEKLQEEWTFSLPKKNGDLKKLKEGEQFKVEIIDAWNMTITEVPGQFETKSAGRYQMVDKEMKRVLLPYTPFIALRITKVKEKNGPN
ncbi:MULTISPECIES: DUF5060 domain-containing protein [Flavobacteriaceae]|uniref:DUF5060 domain-containing protein n=1 Tax=Flavobacteriaceae TaxID=49546 RepID=UPI001FEA8FD2|nr:MULTISPECIES: DUF5060 domain-containing protein [Allomuricauda]MDC6365917.1 DUF5060 domain-containing protein [Muricauda sp. AC10]